MLDALRRDIGDARFFELMKSFFDANTTKAVTTASFRASAESAAGKSLGAFFDTWLNSKGLPGDKGGATYVAGAIRDRLATAIIVYGTNADAGANRHAAEQLQNRFLDMREHAVPVVKDFELSDDAIRAHDVIFVGRPESNSALAAIMTRIGLDYDGAGFRIDGVEHASEYDGMIAAATNPLDPKRMVLVIAGNSALQTVKLAGVFPPETEYAVYARGKEIAAGFRRLSR